MEFPMAIHQVGMDSIGTAHSRKVQEKYTTLEPEANACYISHVLLSVQVFHWRNNKHTKCIVEMYKYARNFKS